MLGVFGVVLLFAVLEDLFGCVGGGQRQALVHFCNVNEAELFTCDDYSPPLPDSTPSRLPYPSILTVL